VVAGTLDSILVSYGYLAVSLFVGIESLGVPFPGETMLITAAIYAGATHHLDIAGVIAAATAGAIVGDNIGYAIGWFGGYRLLRRYGRYIRLDEAKLKVGRYIFMRHGAKVVFFGRFVSVLRTYAAFLAGTNHMYWQTFLIFNALGGVLWSTAFGVAAYLVGSQIERLSGPVNIAFGIAGAAAIMTGLVLLRRHAKRLEAEAARALPGPLERHMTDAPG
jgi:membrane protein DedA with SNARE-associated domain